VCGALDTRRLDQVFDLQRVLRHADRAVVALDELGG
jgi:hypothetical protein